MWLPILSNLGTSFHLLCLEKASKHSRKREFDPWIGEEPLEEGMATHSSILTWKIPWTEELGWLQSMGRKK